MNGRQILWSQTLSGFVTSNEFYFLLRPSVVNQGAHLPEKRYAACGQHFRHFNLLFRHHRVEAKTMFLLLSQVTNANQSVPRHRSTSNLQCIGVEFSVLKSCVTNHQNSWIYCILRTIAKGSRYPINFIFPTILPCLMLVQ